MKEAETVDIAGKRAECAGEQDVSARIEHGGIGVQ
jgi:hypothetical protein